MKSIKNHLSFSFMIMENIIICDVNTIRGWRIKAEQMVSHETIFSVNEEVTTRMGLQRDLVVNDLKNLSQ